LRELRLVALERVAGDEEPERLLLVGETLAFRPVRDVGQALRRAGGAGLRPAQHAEQAGLALLAVALLLLARFHGAVDGRHQGPRPAFERVGRSRLLMKLSMTRRFTARRSIALAEIVRAT
jgi:hypothetical protein